MVDTSYESGMRAGFEVAVENAEVSEHDGWQRTAPFVEWGPARKALEARVAAVTHVPCGAAPAMPTDAEVLACAQLAYETEASAWGWAATWTQMASDEMWLPPYLATIRAVMVRDRATRGIDKVMRERDEALAVARSSASKMRQARRVADAARLTRRAAECEWDDALRERDAARAEVAALAARVDRANDSLAKLRAIWASNRNQPAVAMVVDVVQRALDGAP